MKDMITIVIPTYNRNERLKKQVRMLLPQLKTKAELIVLDNNSDIPIESMFSDLELSKFQIVRNQLNIGGAANIARCFEVCKTKWLWTLSDDDIVKQNAVDIVYSIVSDHEDHVFINFNNKDFESSDFNDIITNSNYYWTLYFISACLYNVQKLRSYMALYYRALSTMQPSIIVFAKYFEDHPNDLCLLSSERITEEDSNEISWNRITFVYASLYAIDMLRDYTSKYKRLFYCIVHDSIYSVYISYKSKRIGLYTALNTISAIVRRRGLIRTLTEDLKAYIKFAYKFFLNR